MSSRLPETELANWSFLPADEKRARLERYEQPKIITGTYEPFRKVFPGAVNLLTPLFGPELGPTPWRDLQAALATACGGNEARLRMNTRVLSATHEYANQQGLAANQLDVLPLSFGPGMRYNFGMNLLIRYPSHAAVAFCDLRRTNRLTDNGMQFVFSALHHRFREAYPDLASAVLEVWRFGTTTNRLLRPVRFDGGVSSWADISADVVETHAIWEEVKRGGEGKRRAAGGGSGPLFD